MYGQWSVVFRKLSLIFFLLICFFRTEFVDHVFSAIILVLCAGISSHLCFGYSSKKSKETFIGLILLTMLGFQLFHLLRAALYVPATQFLVFNKAFHRTDCLESVKGISCLLLLHLNFNILDATDISDLNLSHINSWLISQEITFLLTIYALQYLINLHTLQPLRNTAPDISFRLLLFLPIKGLKMQSRLFFLLPSLECIFCRWLSLFESFPVISVPYCNHIQNTYHHLFISLMTWTLSF